MFQLFLRPLNTCKNVCPSFGVNLLRTDRTNTSGHFQLFRNFNNISAADAGNKTIVLLTLILQVVPFIDKECDR